MNDNNERCQCCGEKFKPGDRIVAHYNESGEVVDRCVLCGEHFKAQDTLVDVTFQRNGIEHKTVTHLVCALRAQLAEKGYK